MPHWDIKIRVVRKFKLNLMLTQADNVFMHLESTVGLFLSYRTVCYVMSFSYDILFRQIWYDVLFPYLLRGR